jgi:hypothetical protein
VGLHERQVDAVLARDAPHGGCGQHLPQAGIARLHRRRRRGGRRRRRHRRGRRRGRRRGSARGGVRGLTAAATTTVVVVVPGELDVAESLARGCHVARLVVQRHHRTLVAGCDLYRRLVALDLAHRVELTHRIAHRHVPLQHLHLRDALPDVCQQEGHHLAAAHGGGVQQRHAAMGTSSDPPPRGPRGKA